MKFACIKFKKGKTMYKKIMTLGLILIVSILADFSLNGSGIFSPDSCLSGEKSTKEVQVECLIKEIRKLDYEVDEHYQKIKTIILEIIALTNKAPQYADFDCLESAIIQGDLPFIKVLLKYNANPEFKNKYGRNAYNYLARYTSERNLAQREKRPTKVTNPTVIKQLLDEHAKNNR